MAATQVTATQAGLVTHDLSSGAVWPAGASLRELQPNLCLLASQPSQHSAELWPSWGWEIPFLSGRVNPLARPIPPLPSHLLPLAAFELQLGPRPKQDNVWAGWTLFFKVFLSSSFLAVDSGPHHPSGAFPEAQNSTNYLL